MAIKLPFDKRRKIDTQGTGRRQVAKTMHSHDVTVNSDVGSLEECSKVGFTKDEMLASLNVRAKAG
ncbi:unnamed protein product [Arabis nemorensis]|uniref:Uncharacterized protein n=1 Tax=Arabis nemorensis TaxID=586526 RepID=A0A565CPX0_9BRAS|nr:unnamed protein product [Arabis nemorensis]